MFKNTNHVKQLKVQSDEKYFNYLKSQLQTKWNEHQSKIGIIDQIQYDIKNYEERIKKHCCAADEKDDSQTLQNYSETLSNLIRAHEENLNGLTIINASIEEIKKQIKESAWYIFHVKDADLYVASTPRIDTELKTIDDYVKIPILNSDLAEKKSPITHINSVKRIQKSNKLLYLIPMLATLAATSELAGGIHTLENSSNKYFNIIPIAGAEGKLILVLVPFLNAILLGNLDLQYTISGINTTVALIKNKKFPRESAEDKHDWPVLPKNKEHLSAFLTFPFISFIALSEAIETFYFINQLPDFYHFSNNINLDIWKAFAILTALNSGIQLPLKEGRDIYIFFRKLFVPNDHSSTPFYNYKLSLLGLPLSLFGAINRTIVSYCVLSFTLAAKTIIDKYILFFGSLIFAGLSDCFFYGKMTMHALDSFITSLYEGFTIKDTIAFLATTFFSLCVSEGMRNLIVYMLTEPELSLPFSLSNPMVQLIGIGTAIQLTINSIYTNYSFIRNPFANFLSELGAWLTPKTEAETKRQKIVVSAPPVFTSPIVASAHVSHSIFESKRNYGALNETVNEPMNKQLVFNS